MPADRGPAIRPVRPALFALPRLATSFVGTAIVTLTLPQLIVAAVGDADKGLHLGAVTAAASLASLAALYLSGRHSDRRRLTSGRGHYPALWLMAMTVPLGVIGAGVPYPALVAAVLGLVIARSLTDAAHLPIIADDFAGHQRGRLSAHIAFCQFLGAGLGAAAFGWLPAGRAPGGMLGADAALAAAALSVAAAVGYRFSFGRTPGRDGEGSRHPAPQPGTPPAGAGPGPMLLPDLVNLLVARTLFLAGIFIVSIFLVYLVRDVLGAPDVERTTAVLYGGTILGALVAALPAGRLSERAGEKPVLIGAGAVVASVAPAFVALAPGRPAVAIGSMLLYGGAFAVVVTAGLSLTLKLVGPPERAGRVLAIASGTTFVSQVIASAAGAVLLDPLNRLRPNAGYWGLTALLELLLLLGGIFLMRVRQSP